MSAHVRSLAGRTTAIIVLLLVAGALSQCLAEARRSGNLFLFRELTPAVQFTAWVPDTNATVRGLIYLGCHGDGADVTWWVRGESNDGRQIRCFCRKYGFGVLGGNNILATNFWSTTDPRHWGPSMQLLDSALQQFAALGHPEFAHIPLIPFGCSNGGVTAWSVTNLLPSQVICTTPDEFPTVAPNLAMDGVLKVPVLCSHAENGAGWNYYPGATLHDSRTRGGLMAWWLQHQTTHCTGPIAEIEVPFWEKCIRARYPASANPATGPVTFTNMTEDSGWAVDTTWRNGLVGIRAYASYSGPENAVGWVPDEDMAHLYRCMASWGPKRYMRVYYNSQRLDSLWPVVPPGARVSLQVCDSTAPVSGFDRVEFYNGATKLGEVTSGSPALDVTLATNGPVAQTFSALIYLPGSVVRATDHPKCLLVVDTTVVTAVWPGDARSTGRRGTTAGMALGLGAQHVYDVAGRLVSRDVGSTTGSASVRVVKASGVTFVRVGSSTR
jgi:hypothetical protein